MAFVKDPNEIGCWWQKQGAKGPYLTGHIIVNGEKISMVCFPITPIPGNDKMPQWRILKSVPKDNRPAAPVARDDDDSIPF